MKEPWFKHYFIYQTLHTFQTIYTKNGIYLLNGLNKNYLPYKLYIFCFDNQQKAVD